MGLKKQIETYKETLAKQNEERLAEAIKEIENRIISQVEESVREIVKEETQKQ